MRARLKPHPLRRPERTPGHAFIGALALALAACGPANEPPKPAPASGEWREFAGSWNAAGTRRSIPLGARAKRLDHRPSGNDVARGRRSVPASDSARTSIALVDSETGLVGRSVWTDERGDQVFSELKGEGTSGTEPHHGHDSGRHGPLCAARPVPTSSPGSS
mgnify:CR=1 FL=1